MGYQFGLEGDFFDKRVAQIVGTIPACLYIALRRYVWHDVNSGPEILREQVRLGRYAARIAQDELAERIGASRKSVQRAEQRLVEAGWIRVYRAHGNASLYLLGERGRFFIAESYRTCVPRTHPPASQSRTYLRLTDAPTCVPESHLPASVGRTEDQNKEDHSEGARAPGGAPHRAPQNRIGPKPAKLDLDEINRRRQLGAEQARLIREQLNRRSS